MAPTKKLLFFFIIISLDCTAQSSLSFYFKPDTTEINGLGYTLSYTSRRTVIENEVYPMRGVHGGIKFGQNRHRLTFAYFWSNLDSDISLLNFGDENANLIDLSSYLKKDLHYYNLMFYPYWVNSKRWKLSTPLEIGVGTSTSSQASIFKEIQPFRKDQYFVPIQFGAYAEFKALRHFGINYELGYRAILKEKNIPLNLNGIYFGLGANIYLGVIYRDFKNTQ
ncbi:hypothetical protein SAMN06298216_1033 [Spirosomataceae bacterium TFI 002]|nr:hypothetical protein SAMN06298216_1033 [Spirosomataceae bacterium TFI 002]